MANVVSSGDLGLLFGYGLFETVMVYDNVPFLLEDHLSRLANSAQALNMTGFSHDKARILIYENVKEINAHPYALRLSFTHGNPKEDIPPAYFLKRREIEYHPSDYENGIAAVMSNFRKNEHSKIIRHKTFNFLENYLALQFAKLQGVSESIFLNTSDCLCEGSVSNLFFFSKNVIRTPSIQCGILLGITRNLILKLSTEEGIKTEEGVYHTKEMLESEECFLTNSVMEVMPLVSVDGIKIGEGIPGEVTKKITALYRKSVSEYVTNSKNGV